MTRLQDIPDPIGELGMDPESYRSYMLGQLEARKGKPHVLYQRRPVDWLEHVLGFEREHIEWTRYPEYADHRWDGTPDPLVKALTALANWQWCAVEAGTATSKTYTLGAGGMLWFLAAFENARVVTVAPKEDQLTRNLWKEVSELWPRFARYFPDATQQHLNIRMRGGIDENWAAVGMVAGVGADEDAANKARGYHARHMLFIVEEGPGVHQAIWNAIKNTSKSPHNLIIGLGNPDNAQDPLHKFGKLKRCVSVRISGHDFPNVVVNGARNPGAESFLEDEEVIPGGMSRQGVADSADDYGEDTPMYKRMVRGIAPAQAKDALIRLEWCEKAAEKYGDPEYRKGPLAMGVDVANSETGDKAAKSFWVGETLDELVAHQCPDASILGAEVAVDIAVRGIDPRQLGVDPVGVGASTVNKLKELDVHGQWLNGGSRPWPEVDDHGAKPVRKEELFINLRAQMYWRMRDDLQHGRIALPNDSELFEDLCTPTYWTKGGRIHVESKEDLVKRLGRSPDKADAAVYGNFVRVFEREEQEEEDLSAWDEDVLAHEAQECRRISTKPERVTDIIHPEFGPLL